MGEGFVIAMDSVDGGGKGTQISWLARNLRSGFPSKTVIKTREPYDEPENTIGVAIRSILEHREKRPPNAEAFQYLFYLDRVEHWRRVLNPAKDSGHWALTDRERKVTYAHGVAGGVPLEKMVEWHSDLPVPDLYIYLQVTAETAIERIKMRNTEMGKVEDYFEKEETFRKNVAAFDKIAKLDVIPNLVVIDGNLRRDKVAEAVWETVLDFIDNR